MPAHGGEHHRGVRLATYAIPWAAINLSAPERAVYESLIAAPPNPEHAYVSASAAIYRTLPGAMAAAPIADRPERHHTVRYILRALQNIRTTDYCSLYTAPVYITSEYSVL